MASLGNKVICRYSGFTFQTFVYQNESIIRSPLLKGFPFKFSKNANHRYLSLVQPKRVKSKEYAKIRNLSNQNPNPALKTKTGNKLSNSLILCPIHILSNKQGLFHYFKVCLFSLGLKLHDHVKEKHRKWSLTLL